MALKVISPIGLLQNFTFKRILPRDVDALPKHSAEYAKAGVCPSVTAE